jgi:Domain of unknown function (DUF929)
MAANAKPAGGNAKPTASNAKLTGAAAAQRQARAAALRAAQTKKDRQRKAIWISVTAVVAVLAVIGVLVGVKVGGGSSKSTAAGATGPASAAVVNGVTKVPAATLTSVAAGGVQTLPKALNAPALTADGKPRVLYIGAEYCPYCAAERWGMVVAMSRFGTWSNLETTSSSATDVDPSTPTLSFHGATYTSSYLSFTGVEETTNVPSGSGYQTLDTPSAADSALLAKYDAPPYVDSSSTGAIPFVDIGGKFLISGASYDPKTLAGKTHEQVAAALADPNNAIAKAVDGTANAITAALCTLTANKPASVCSAPDITALKSAIAAQG